MRNIYFLTETTIICLLNSLLCHINFRFLFDKMTIVSAPVSQMVYARMRKEDGTVDDKMPLKEAINTAFTEVVKPEQRVTRTARFFFSQINSNLMT